MLCEYFIWFIIFSFMGWIYESIYCTIKGHQWENRGFLHGPIVPIYGVGALLASILFRQLPFETLTNASNLQIFFICMIGSAIIEYVTSWTLEKLFHAYWWDYSKMPLNINGRVCVFFSIGFGIAGILVIHYIYPFVSHITGFIPPMLQEFIALILVFLLGMDVSLTVSTLTNFSKNVLRIEDEINQQIAAAYDSLEENIAEKRETLREGLMRQKVDSLWNNTSFHQRSTLSHIQGIRSHHSSKMLREKILLQIKDRLHQKKDR